MTDISVVGMRCPNALFNIPEGSTVVTDPDEEILELYMNLATTSASGSSQPSTVGNLGSHDSTRSILELELELVPPSKAVAEGRVRIETPKPITITVKLQQDLHVLKQSKGDTGSVLWRSSLHLARHILTQHAFPTTTPAALLNPDQLHSARILELGAGTGLLAILLSPLCANYVASDRYENLRLIQRNLALNGIGDEPKGPRSPEKKSQAKMAGKAPAKTTGSVRIEEVDWMAISRNRNKPGRPCKDKEDASYDLILVVDCVYNEALVQPLVDTLAHFCSAGGRTVVWVVVELRSSDVLTLFLNTWLNDPSGPWTIIRLNEKAMGFWDGIPGRWVGWLGWR